MSASLGLYHKLKSKVMIPLKTTLTINAASSGVTGLGLIILASPVAELFGVSQTMPFVGVGVFLILFASFVFLVGVSKSINPKAVRLIITLDTLWVVASLVLVAVASSSISLIGILTILAVAMWVAAMAFLQHKGMSTRAALIIVICILSSLQNRVVAQSSEVRSSEINSDNIRVEAEALQIVNSFLEAVKQMSHSKAFPLLDSMIQWDQPGNNRFSGLKQGATEVFGMFKGFLDASASTLRLTEIKVLTVNDNQVACHLHWSATQPPGGVLDVDNIDVYTVENGKIVKAVVYSADIRSEDRFWAK
jgi:hypothetical protein